MPTFVERETTQTAETLTVRPEKPEISKELEEVGVTTPQTQVTAQVTDDSGQALVTPTVATLQIPADQLTLTNLSKGNVASAITWLATFWLRMIKKAIHFGWKIITR